MVKADHRGPVKRCRPALGTFIEIEVEDVAAAVRARVDAIREAIDAAFEAIARVDAAMSFHRANSDVSRLNQSTGGAVLTLDPWTIEVLRLAAQLQRDSDGLFDCAVGAELISSGLLPGELRPSGSGSLLRDVVFLDASTVRVDAPICLDLGGLAKGFAVDRAIDALKVKGVRQGCVNAGGDLRVLGPSPRQIHLRSASGAGCLRSLGFLSDGAIATSSTGFTGGFDAGGTWHSALLDPRTRQPIASDCNFSVIAQLCAVADGLTKVVAVTGRTDHPSLQRYGALAILS